jgi:N-methylhydantoinase A
VFLDADGRLHIKKVSSSVEDYARAIVDGLREVFDEAGLGGRDVVEVLHGTTVASNALLELSGARTGLITTRGFRDVLEIRRLRMPRLYDLTWEKPPTLVERRLRMEVGERIDAHGAIQQPLHDADVERALDRLLGQESKRSRCVCSTPGPTRRTRSASRRSRSDARPACPSASAARYCRRSRSTSAPPPP